MWEKVHQSKHESHTFIGWFFSRSSLLFASIYNHCFSGNIIYYNCITNQSVYAMLLRLILNVFNRNRYISDRFLTFPNQHGTFSSVLMLSINAFFNLCTVHQSPKTSFSIQHWKRVCEREQRNKRKTKSTMRPLTARIDWRSTHSNVCVR